VKPAPHTALRRLVAAALGVSALLLSAPTSADIANFDLAGKIYTKFLYRNNDSQGILTYGNPFWQENFSGDNGVGTEFELKIMGAVSAFVEADVRLKSRFGSVWQDFYESGNVRHDEPNTSAESLGLDHAEYVKLRGYRILIRPPYPYISQVTVGSTDLGMFNPWTIGQIRYTDRDNTKAVFLQGEIADDTVEWLVGAIALPKLWAGPGWTTGLGDEALDHALWSTDWAYGARLDFNLPDARLTFIGTTTLDYEINRADPDAIGALYPNCKDDLGDPIPGCERDHAVDLEPRYNNSVATAELAIDAIEDVSINLLGAGAASRIGETYVTNGVADNAGVFPLPYKDTLDGAVRARAELYEPFGLDELTLKLEYFYVGAEFVSHFAARREADVLLTDGLIEGGQLPTLNIANEFQDFDEPFFESIIGWHGGTVLLGLDLDPVTISLEQTALTYATNQQGRDVEEVYPDFLHTDGFTDTVLYDYANVLDRGRDPRSVYRHNQDRFTTISVLNTSLILESLGDLEVALKMKYIRDVDGRNTNREDDNYTGDILYGRLTLTMPLGDELKLSVGGQWDRWMEEARSGNESAGYQDYDTTRARGFTTMKWVFGGAEFGYILEYIHKIQDRELDDDQRFDVLRSKATLAVSW
jgi:hypothetical protein